jgi:hypothetical protein
MFSYRHIGRRYKDTAYLKLKEPTAGGGDMTIRPIDMQVNVMKEGDQAKNAEKDKLQQDGQSRFGATIQKEQDEKKEKIQEFENATFNNIDERKRGKGNQSGENQKKDSKETANKKDHVDVKDPNRGNLIDIKS